MIVGEHQLVKRRFVSVLASVVDANELLTKNFLEKLLLVDQLKARLEQPADEEKFFPVEEKVTKPIGDGSRRIGAKTAFG